AGSGRRRIVEMTKPAVTVLMATYNHAAYIRQALDTLASQSFPRDSYEVIVVNDGSTDNTAKILQDYASWIRLVNQQNAGLVAACNTGLALAQGRYLCRLDSDDYVSADWLPS